MTCIPGGGKSPPPFKEIITARETDPGYFKRKGMEQSIIQQLKYHAERIKALSEDRNKHVMECMGGIQFHIKQINEILDSVKKVS